VNERVADGVTLLWKGYVGKKNYVFTCHPLIFGDRIYHASNGDKLNKADRWDRLYCFSREGRLLWSFSPPDGGDTSLNGVVATPEFVVVGSDNGYVYCVSHSGELLWKFKTGGSVKSFSVGDVDGDGEMEVLAGSMDNNLYCVSGVSGREEWRFTTGSLVWSSPAIGDVDGDGEMEVVVGSEDGNLYCLSGGSGGEEWRFKTGDSILSILSSPAIGDVDGDGEMEVIVGSADHNLYCVSGRSGKEKWRFKTGSNVESSPAIGDVDGDARAEIAVASEDGWLYLLKIEKPIGEILWPRWRGDAQGTGLLECARLYGLASQFRQYGVRVFSLSPRLLESALEQLSRLGKKFKSAKNEAEFKQEIEKTREYIAELERLSELSEEKRNLPKRIEKEKQKEIARIEREYLKPRGEFEKIAQYQARLRKGKLLKQEVERRYSAKLAKLKSETAKLDSQIRELTDKVTILLKVDRIGAYDADNETFPITVQGRTENVHVPIDIAPDFKRRKDELVVKAKCRLNEELEWEFYDFVIQDPKSGRDFPFGASAKPTQIVKTEFPPNLSASVSFSDADGNRFLDAGETATLKVTVRNDGRGKAQGVSVVISTDYEMLLLSSAVADVGDIPSGEERDAEFKLIAPEDVEGKDVKLKVEVLESAGFDATPVEVSFRTRAVQPPEIGVARYILNDGSTGLASGNGDGKIQPGEQVELTCFLQNVGLGDARGVTARLVSSDPNVQVVKGEQKDIGGISSGDWRKAIFAFRVNRRFRGRKLPLSVSVKDARERFKWEIPLDIYMEVSYEEPVVVKVEGKASGVVLKQLPQIAKEDSEGPRIVIIEPTMMGRGIAVVPKVRECRVRGLALDVSGVAYVEVNGERAQTEEIDGGVEFRRTLQVAGEREVVILAVDGKGNVGELRFRITSGIAEMGEIERWAVVIGISRYSDENLNLKYADSDATAFYEFLRSEEGGGFPEDHVKLLLNEDATYEKMKEALFSFLGRSVKEDMVVIFFAGHGAPDPQREENLYLLPYDVKVRKLSATAFPMWDIRTALERYISAEKVVVIADACHSGGVGKEVVAMLRGENPINRYLHQLGMISKSTAVLTASGENERSMEDERWGGGHGVFTWCLLEGLKGRADEYGDGMVTLKEIGDYVREKVRRETGDAQHPVLTGRYDGNLPMAVIPSADSTAR